MNYHVNYHWSYIFLRALEVQNSKTSSHLDPAGTKVRLKHQIGQNTGFNFKDFNFSNFKFPQVDLSILNTIKYVTHHHEMSRKSQI